MVLNQWKCEMIKWSAEFEVWTVYSQRLDKRALNLSICCLLFFHTPMKTYSFIFAMPRKMISFFPRLCSCHFVSLANLEQIKTKQNKSILSLCDLLSQYHFVRERQRPRALLYASYIAQLLKRVLPHFSSFSLSVSLFFSVISYLFLSFVCLAALICQWTVCVFHFCCYFRVRQRSNRYVRQCLAGMIVWSFRLFKNS